VSGGHQRGALFRPIVPNQHSRVTYAELFFDLLFLVGTILFKHTIRAAGFSSRTASASSC
jgi:low temperature requirement protein LtrA